MAAAMRPPLTFVPNPVDLTPLRRTLRRVAGAHPDRVPACTQILRAAIADLEAVAVPVVDTSPTGTADPVPPARTVPLSLSIDRRHRTRTGGYWQSPFRYRGGLSASVELALPPLDAWTPATVAELLAAARVALRVRGATGACRVSAHGNDSSWRPETVTLCVRIGSLRARALLAVDCGCRHVPSEVLEALHQAVPGLTSLRGALEYARAL